jgi:hypothetical protein
MSAWDTPEGDNIIKAIKTLYPDPAEVVAILALHDDFMSLTNSLFEMVKQLTSESEAIMKKFEAIKKGRQDEKNSH